MLLHFLRAETGAVTVDWVVLAASTVGLGLASAVAVRQGISHLGGSIETSLTDASVASLSNSFSQTLASFGFDGGVAGDWVGGSVLSPIAALGELLVLGPGEYAQLNVDIPAGLAEATISFDLIGGDSLDSETLTIQVNGQTVSLARGVHNGTMTFTNPALEGYTVTTETITSGTNLGGAAPTNWMDSVTRVTITADNPGSSVTLGLQSGANQAIGDEFFGIDNLTVTGG